MDRHDLDGLAGGKPEELERLERARGLSSASIDQADTLSLRDRTGNDHPGPRAPAQALGEWLVGPLLGLEVEVRLSPEDDHVTALSLAQDAGGRVADVLEHLDGDAGRLTARAEIGEEIRHPSVRVGEAGFVAGLLVGAGPEGDWLRSFDGGRVEDTETEQVGAIPAGPVDGEIGRTFAVSRAVQRNQRRSTHGRGPLPATLVQTPVKAP